MQRTTLTTVFLIILATPVAVMAELPAVTANPLESGAAPVDVESAARQAVEKVAGEAAAAAMPAEQQPVAETQPQETPAEAPATAAASAAQAVTDTAEAAAAGMAMEQAVPEKVTEAAAPAAGTSAQQAAPESAAPDTGAADDVWPYKPCPKHGMRHRGKGMYGMRHGPGPGGMGRGERHQQVVERLDMIEARMAKIEAMLERLMIRSGN